MQVHFARCSEGMKQPMPCFGGGKGPELARNHFARCFESKKQPVPCFGGSKGPELARNLREIEQTFDKYLMGLMAVRKTILNVKCSTWHDDYIKFWAGIKDLEVIIQNVINSSFRSITSVEEGV